MKKKLQHLDLFSGIGGFSLGLEEIGLVETVAFCDFDKYCQQVLKKHWPSVPIFSDIKELTYEKLKANGINKIDIITGGYPCQPFSVAGSQKGEQDPRHVWPEYFRLVKELKPTWVIGENVSGHIKLGLDTVLENLESEGYSTRTFSISASSVGANHQRERVWIIAHLANTSTHRSFDEPKRNIGGLAKESGRKEETRHQPSVCIETRSSKRSKNVANSNNAGDRTSEYETNKNREKTDERWQEQSQFEFSRQSENVADSDDKRIWSRIGGSDHDNEKKSGGWSFDRGRSNGNDEWSDSSTTKNETMDVADTNSDGHSEGVFEERYKNNAGQNSSAFRRESAGKTFGQSDDGGNTKESRADKNLSGPSVSRETDVARPYEVRGISTQSNISQGTISTDTNKENDDRALVSQRQRGLRLSKHRELGDDKETFEGNKIRQGDDNINKQGMADVADTNSKRGRLWETGSKDAKDVGQSPRGQETLGWWDIEPDVGRVAHGVPKRVDRLKSLGNSLVPQIPFLIGSCIKEIEGI